MSAKQRLVDQLDALDARLLPELKKEYKTAEILVNPADGETFVLRLSKGTKVAEVPFTMEQIKFFFDNEAHLDVVLAEIADGYKATPKK